MNAASSTTAPSARATIYNAYSRPPPAGQRSSLRAAGMPEPLTKLGTMVALWLSLLLAASFHCTTDAFKVASFNIARFGMSKVTDPTVKDLLIQILRRYELISIQEVMDSDNDPIFTLVRELNQATGLPYNVLVSDHLGRSSYREKYAYVYREDILKPTAWYHYDDGCENCGTDTFIREPFVARFSSPTTVVKDLVLVSIHTSPDYAVREVDALFDVWEDAQQRLLTQDILVLGDYNADCKYVTSKHWPSIRLRQSQQLHWLISDEEDTTVSENTHCAYDRFVVSGVNLLNAIVPETARAFNYHSAYGLSYDMAKAVSDHYPVELELKLDGNYAGERFPTGPTLGINGGLSTNGECSCSGVDFNSCQGRCGANSRTFPCNCNASCGDSGRCCADYKVHC
ncbi:deoxyribonuclease-1-like [Ambystoma mexicanum]|uniref:deoxyribonuclease-1-like n=1 Tax=Ambystoma mexicanum TaxID=8296 RepID=UPI0037E8598C